MAILASWQRRTETPEDISEILNDQKDAHTSTDYIHIKIFVIRLEMKKL